MAGTATISWINMTAAFDSDAQAFFTATGITDSTTKNAVNTLVVAAKANGWWTLCNAIYPMVGGTSTTCKYNLKDPQDTDGAFRLSFSGVHTFGSTGITWNGSGYADTHLIPNSVLSQDSTHFSIYARTEGSQAGASGIGDNPSIIISKREPGDVFFYAVNEGAGANGTNTNGTGFYLVTRGGSGDVRAYKNASLLTSSSNTSSGLSTLSLYLGDGHAASMPYFPETSCEYAFATVGSNISGAIASVMYSDIQTFQTSLSRNV